MSVLVVFSHSYQEQSVSGVAIADVFASAGFQVRNLEKLYPQGNIDADAERKAVEEADVVVFLHPIFWYNVPSLLKKWQDEVLAFGWAYGVEEPKTKGKKFVQVYTTGAGRDKYTDEVVTALEAPLKAAAGFANFSYAGAFGIFGQLSFTNANAKEDAVAFATKVVESIKAL